MSVLVRNNVKVAGRGSRSMVFAHGFGCDQNMWRFVAPAFEKSFRTVIFDNVGAGGSDLNAFSYEKYSSLHGYANDLIEIGRELNVEAGVFVGHSVSAMIGILAAKQAPDLFESLVLVGPSPRYIDDEDYTGGFSIGQIEELLEFLDSNHMGWSAAMAPVIMGNPQQPELSQELTNSFCRTDPQIAKHFARTTFMSDNRDDLIGVTTRALVLQCKEDVIAPISVGEYVHGKLGNSKLVILDATGHCPNLSAPDAVIKAIEDFV